MQDVRRSRFEGSYYLLGTQVLESPLFSYKRVQGGFEGTSVGEEAAIRTTRLSKFCIVPFGIK